MFAKGTEYNFKGQNCFGSFLDRGLKGKRKHPNSLLKKGLFQKKRFALITSWKQIPSFRVGSFLEGNDTD